MGRFVEPVGEFVLETTVTDQVCVSHRNGAVWIEGYDQVISLGYRGALALAEWLGRYHGFLQDCAVNYYECRECGLTHHKSVEGCPALSGGDVYE